MRAQPEQATRVAGTALTGGAVVLLLANVVEALLVAFGVSGGLTTVWTLLLGIWTLRTARSR